MIRKSLLAIFSSLGLAIAVPNAALAGSNVKVTPAKPHGWTTADTRPGGAVNFIVDATAPLGKGALQLTTDTTTTAKAQYLHGATVPLADVSKLSYSTKQVSALFAGGDPSYQLIVYLNGGTDGFTTLVFEPYQNPAEGPVIPGKWQSWDVASGLFWSTRKVTCSNGTVAGTPGGPASYTLQQIKTLCPSAVSGGFGVNIGSNNPGYNVETDAFNFNGTTYNFEPARPAENEDSCKGSEDSAVSNPSPGQGECVSDAARQHDSEAD